MSVCVLLVLLVAQAVELVLVFLLGASWRNAEHELAVLAAALLEAVVAALCADGLFALDQLRVSEGTYFSVEVEIAPVGGVCELLVGEHRDLERLVALYADEALLLGRNQLCECLLHF